MFINSESLLRRHNSLQWCRQLNEIAKYSPESYDAFGVCNKDDWTSYYDINKSINGNILSLKEYLEVENNYIETVIEILETSQITFLTIGYIEKDSYYSVPFEQSLLDQKDLSTFFEKCTAGMRININSKELILLLKLCLREKLWCILVNLKKNFELSFGYKLYLIIHAAISVEELNIIAKKHHLYLNARK